MLEKTLNKIIEESGISQLAFSEKINCSNSYLTMIKKGIRPLPSNILLSILKLVKEDNDKRELIRIWLDDNHKIKEVESLLSTKKEKEEFKNLVSRSILNNTN